MNRILVVYAKLTSTAQKKTYKAVMESLKAKDLTLTVIERDDLAAKDIKSKDLVIVLGGDGTFLEVAHLIFDSTPMLGVNTDPACKEGFFMQCNEKNFDRKIKRILAGKFAKKQLNRLEAWVDSKRIKQLALNEFYVAADKGYLTARYYLQVRGKIERQKSSGVLVGTASGSHAWIKSAGGKPMNRYSKKMQFVVREPYRGENAHRISLKQGIVGPEQTIRIQLEVGKGMVIVDSLSQEYAIGPKNRVTIQSSDKPITVIEC